MREPCSLVEDLPLVPSGTALKVTPLNALHRTLGARMVPFAGYDMPVQYPAGIIAEHLQTRSQAGLFDVSHMGQMRIGHGDGVVAAARALETLVPADIQGLVLFQQRYTQFTDEAGGILDDLMVANAGDVLTLVVNASRKDADLAHLQAHLPKGCTVTAVTDRALLALQGPAAAAVLSRLAPEAESMGFMSARDLTIDGTRCFVTRSGYTGEDGFEISVPDGDAERLARRLLDAPEVQPVGLGARDSLRLEAGLCLYGQDIDTGTTPAEAGLGWSIQKRRRVEGGFPGAARILAQLAEGPPRRRVGLLPEGKAPARAHTEFADAVGAHLGEVTSGGYGPSVGGPIAMGYVTPDSAAAGTALTLVVRGKPLPARVVRMPFVPTRYHKAEP
jgi:aminomethyltransferase